MNPVSPRSARRIVVAIDVVCVVTSALAAHGIHELARRSVPALRALPSADRYATVAILVLPIWLGLARVLRLHQVFEEAWPLRRLLAREIVLHVLGFFGLSALLFVTQTVINRSVVALFLASSFITTLGARVFLLRGARRRHASGETETRILLVGAASDEMRAWVETLRRPPYPVKVLGRIGEGAGDETLPHLGGIDRLLSVLEVEAVDHVAFFRPYQHPEDTPELLSACEDRGIPASYQVVMPRPTSATPRVFDYQGQPFVTFELAPRSAELLAIKHGFDFVAALVLLSLALPVLLLSTIAILISMGRPILFVQERAGRNGRSFRLLKLRTMVPDAEERKASLLAEGRRGGPTFKLTDDPRVTRLGALLRRYSIDELPQLLNVLAGSMSLVGPRPLPLEEQRAIVGWHRRRLAMKPGITGLWQVSGRSDLGHAEWMRLDVRYVDTWSLREDAWILLRTLPAVLARRGAY